MAMRWAWLRALVLGFMLGPTTFITDGADGEPPEAERPAAEKSMGHFVQGLNFYVWEEDSREASEWALDLLLSGGETMEGARWRGVAARSAALPPILTQDSEAALASWIEASAGDSRPAALGPLLCLLPSLDRTCLVSSWATSSDEKIRCALATALSAPFEAVGVRAALEHLQQDPSAEVRRLARFAAASRRSLA